MLAFISSLFLRSGHKRAPHVEGAKPVPVRDIIRSPGFAVVFSVSVVSVVAQDLIVVYLPLMGTERNIAVDVIGSLLAVRAFAAVFSRLFFAKLSMMLGSTQADGDEHDRRRAGVRRDGRADLAAADVRRDRHPRRRARHRRDHGDLQPARAWSRAKCAAPPTRCAPAARGSGRSIIPFLAGLLAAAMGVASVFLVLGASLAVAATAVQFTRPKSSS